MSVNVWLLMPPPPAPPDERPDDLVNANYVAARFGCSASSVRHRKAGTKDLPRISNSPIRFRRGDVDAAVLKLIEASRKPKHPVYRRSLIRRHSKKELM